MRHATLILAILLAGAAATAGAAPGYRFRKIVDSTIVPPGLTEPLAVIDELAFDGQYVALRAQTASGVRGVYVWNGSTLATIADTQTAVPNGGGTFTMFHSLALDEGRVAFGAEGTVKQGVYTDLGGSLRRVADTTSAMPGGGGAVFSDFTETYGVAIDGSTIALTGFGAGGSGPQEGLYVETSGSLARVADRSTIIPGTATTFLFFREVDVSEGDVIFSAGRGSGGFNGVFTTADAAPGSLHVVADANTAINGLVNPLRFVSPTAVRINGPPRAFVARDELQNQGIYREAAGAITTIADKFTLDPLTGAAFTALGGAFSLSEGAIAFYGASTGPGGIYVHEDGTLASVIKAGDSLQSKQISMVNLFANSLDGGRIAFAAKLIDPAPPHVTSAAAYLAEPLNMNGGPNGHTFWPLFDAVASGGLVADGATRIDVLRADDAPDPIDRRAVFEFDLSDLPAGAQVQSARLELDLASLDSTPSEGPMVTAYGYVGNGTLEPADAGQTAVVLGQSPMALELGTFEFALDGAVVQEFVDQGSVLGVVLRGDESSRLLGLRTLEAWNGNPLLLTLAYTTPPNADFDSDGFVNGADLEIWRSHFGAQEVDRAHGDADGDGDVDGADVLAWQQGLSGGSPTMQAPEPNSAAIVAGCAASALAFGAKRPRRRGAPVGPDVSPRRRYVGKIRNSQSSRNPCGSTTKAYSMPQSSGSTYTANSNVPSFCTVARRLNTPEKVTIIPRTSSSASVTEPRMIQVSLATASAVAARMGGRFT
jgi:hypothetical protein